MHKAKWLHGKWVFDADYTKLKLEEAQQQSSAKKDGVIEGLKGIATGLLTAPLLGALEGAQLTVTDTELIMTGKDGNGKAFKYEVLEAPNAETLSLKQSDGEVKTYHREGDRFWTTAGATSVRAYFRRVK